MPQETPATWGCIQVQADAQNCCRNKHSHLGRAFRRQCRRTTRRHRVVQHSLQPRCRLLHSSCQVIRVVVHPREQQRSHQVSRPCEVRVDARDVQHQALGCRAPGLRPSRGCQERDVPATAVAAAAATATVPSAMVAVLAAVCMGATSATACAIATCLIGA